MTLAHVAQDLFADCQSDEEVLEAARHIAADGAEAGFSPREIEAARWVVEVEGLDPLQTDRRQTCR